MTLYYIPTDAELEEMETASAEDWAFTLECRPDLAAAVNK